MKTRSNALVTAAAIAAWMGCGMSAAKADDAHCYTLASLKGTFAGVTTYGDHVAEALSVRHYDGDGNTTGTFTVNEPVVGSPTGERKIVTGTQVGTYMVNCDGTGATTRLLTTANGTVTQVDDFVITQALTRDGKLLATVVVDMTRTPSGIVPGGLFVTRTFTRRPD